MAPDPTTRIPRSLNYDTPPGLEVAAGSQGKIVRLSGQWTALALARDRATGKVVPRLRSLIGVEGMHWDLSRIERMDHVGGQALWRVGARSFVVHHYRSRMERGLTNTDTGMLLSGQ